MAVYNKDYRAIAKSRLFSGKWYLKHNPDLKRAKVNPVLHYLRHGWKEERPCTKYFNGQRYLEMNPDVASANMNPLAHYERFGKKEGRYAEISGKRSRICGCSCFPDLRDWLHRVAMYPIEVEMECRRLEAELKSKR